MHFIVASKVTKQYILIIDISYGSELVYIHVGKV